MTKKEARKDDSIPSWSWVASAVGMTLAIGSAVFMLHNALTNDSSLPEIRIETDSIVRNGGGYVVPMRVMNAGESVAADLLIEGVLEERGVTVETSRITLDYVPASSERRAGLIFRRDPRGFDMRIEAKGYVEP